MTIGIYKIENMINHKKYIGQSINIEKRWNKHKTTYLKQYNRCYEYPLYRAFRKYGIENFTFSILEECSSDELNQREIYWIDFYDTFFNGYNQTFGGDASRVVDKEKIKGVIFDLKNTNNKHSDIAEKWNISTEMVQGINTGRYWFHNADYPLQKRTKDRKRLIRENKNKTGIDCGKPIYKTAIRCVSCEYKRRITIPPLLREDLKNKIRNESFTKIGKEFNVSDNAIRKWRKKYGLPYKTKEIKSYSDEEWSLL